MLPDGFGVQRRTRAVVQVWEIRRNLSPLGKALSALLVRFSCPAVQCPWTEGPNPHPFGFAQGQALARKEPGKDWYPPPVSVRISSQVRAIANPFRLGRGPGC